MGFSKLLLILLAIWLLRKIYLAYKKMRSDKISQSSDSTKVVPCSFCKVHIPINKATVVRNRFYCSEEHSKNA